MSISPSVSGQHCFLVSSVLTGFYTLSVSSSSVFPDPWLEGFDGDITFIAECSKLSHPARCLVVGLFY